MTTMAIQCLMARQLVLAVLVMPEGCRAAGRSLQQQQPGSAALSSFSCPRAGALPGANIELEGGRWYLELSDASSCATACLGTPGCVSFDYSTLDGRCYLGDDVLDAAGLLVPSTGYFYYEGVALGSAQACNYGCTTAEAVNYDATAEEDDGSCVTRFEGCGDRLALNFNATVNVNNSRYCAYSTLALGFSCPVSGSWVPSTGDQEAVDGYNISACADLCLATAQCVGFVHAAEGRSCRVAATQPVAAGAAMRRNFYRRRPSELQGAVCVFGCNESGAANFDATAEADDGSCAFPRGCTDPSSALYDPAAVQDDGSCNTTVLSLFTCPSGAEATDAPIAAHANATVEECAGMCSRNASCLSFDYQLVRTSGPSCTLHEVDGQNATVVSNNDYARYIRVRIAAVGCIYGCTDRNALNFDESAEDDDRSCVMPMRGCTDPTALNYLPGANTDNGTCVTTLLGLRFECPVPGVLFGHNINNIPNHGAFVPGVTSPAVKRQRSPD